MRPASTTRFPAEAAITHRGGRPRCVGRSSDLWTWIIPGDPPTCPRFPALLTSAMGVFVSTYRCGAVPDSHRDSLLSRSDRRSEKGTDEAQHIGVRWSGQPNNLWISRWINANGAGWSGACRDLRFVGIGCRHPVRARPDAYPGCEGLGTPSRWPAGRTGRRRTATGPAPPCRRWHGSATAIWPGWSRPGWWPGYRPAKSR